MEAVVRERRAHARGGRAGADCAPEASAGRGAVQKLAPAARVALRTLMTGARGKPVRFAASLGPEMSDATKYLWPIARASVDTRARPARDADRLAPRPAPSLRGMSSRSARVFAVLAPARATRLVSMSVRASSDAPTGSDDKAALETLIDRRSTYVGGEQLTAFDDDSCSSAPRGTR